jgi:hypothetical protein
MRYLRLTFGETAIPAELLAVAGIGTLAKAR